MHALNHTHDVHARSWVESANPTATHSSDFPIQNLPFGRFRAAGSTEAFRIGVAIGDQVLDLRAAGLVDSDDMNALMAATAPRSARRCAPRSRPASPKAATSRPPGRRRSSRRPGPR
jgi:fumarylacetoacetase